MMMTAVTYDMQKLDEAVGILASGTKPLQERLRDAIVPLGTLSMGGGMTNKARNPELEAIYKRLTDADLASMSDDDARDLASAIVSLHSSNWHDAVWSLEDSAKA